MKIAIGSDHAGFKLKKSLKKFLIKKGYDIEDFGAYSEERCDYPRIGYKVARLVATSKFDKGILICATGIGQSIVANRLPGIRAALCYNIKCARLSREHNDSNIIIFGAKFIKEKTAQKALDLWLNTDFIGGRHLSRLEQIRKLEDSILKDT